MLAHSRAYVDQLRTRVDEAGSSVECLTAVDGSEDDLGGLGGGDRGMSSCHHVVSGCHRGSSGALMYHRVDNTYMKE